MVYWLSKQDDPPPNSVTFFMIHPWTVWLFSWTTLQGRIQVLKWGVKHPLSFRQCKHDLIGSNLYNLLSWSVRVRVGVQLTVWNVLYCIWWWKRDISSQCLRDIIIKLYMSNCFMTHHRTLYHFFMTALNSIALYNKLSVPYLLGIRYVYKHFFFIINP